MGMRNCNTTAKLQTAEDQREDTQETNSSLTLELLGLVLTLYSILCFMFDPQQVTTFRKKLSQVQVLQPQSSTVEFQILVQLSRLVTQGREQDAASFITDVNEEYQPSFLLSSSSL